MGRASWGRGSGADFSDEGCVGVAAGDFVAHFPVFDLAFLRAIASGVALAAFE
jgi:hypothetical protein